MTLEHDIHQQKPFKSEHSKVIVNLIYTYNQLKGSITESLKDYGLTMQQYNVLRIVRGAGEEGITTSDIRERMLDKMSDASRMVDRLCAMDLVEKIRDRNDRRLMYVHLTPKGSEAVNAIVESNVVDQLATHLSKENAQQLNELLDALRSGL